MRNFAQHLIAYETRRNKLSKTKARVADLVVQKLRPDLTNLMGNTGFCALLSRALALANVEIPWLRAVHVNTDGSLEGLDEFEAQLTPDDFLEGGVVLLAQLLGLLMAFIGEKLTLQVVRSVWTQLSFNGLERLVPISRTGDSG